MNNQIVNASRDRLASIEGKLAGALKPVKPSQEFVRHVRERIQFASAPVVADRLHDPNYLMFLLGSVLTVALLIITGTRALFYFIGRIK
jgi:hypothetical protein